MHLSPRASALATRTAGGGEPLVCAVPILDIRLRVYLEPKKVHTPHRVLRSIYKEIPPADEPNRIFTQPASQVWVVGSKSRDNKAGRIVFIVT